MNWLTACFLFAAILGLVIWLFCSRLYPTDPEVTALFLSIAARDDLQIEGEDSCTSDWYYLIVTCGIGRLRFWNANKPYGWANNGSFEADGSPEMNLVWKDVMPSRRAARAMAKRIGTRGAPVRSWRGPNPPSHLRQFGARGD